MIARLHGEIIEKGDASAIVDVNGVGYEVSMTSLDLAACELSAPITLYTHFHVREQSQELFGFREFETKKLFEVLIGVSGVGPKMAMSILGLGEQGQIRQAIASANTAYISGASGVGKRLAERVVVDLKDKVGVLAGEVVQDFDGSPSGDDAVDALISLGYSKVQAINSLSKTNLDDPIEDRLKQALKNL